MEVKEIEEFIKVPTIQSQVFSMIFYSFKIKMFFSNSVNLLAKLIKIIILTLLPLLTPEDLYLEQVSIKLDTGLIMIRKSNKLP